MTQEEISAQLHELATSSRILAAAGHEDITSGHISWRDPNGRGFWIKRAGIGLDEVVAPQDLHLVDFDGNVIEGEGKRHNEWPIHAEIYRARKDVNCVGHTHAFYAQIFSTTDEPLRPVGKHGHWFDDLPKFKKTCQLIRTPQLGKSLAKTLAGNDAVFMMSHGIAFVGKNIRDATLCGVYLEKAVKAQITIAQTGWKYGWPSHRDIVEKRKQTRTESGIDNYWEYLKRHLPEIKSR